MATYNGENPQLENDIDNYLIQLFKLLTEKGYSDVRDFLDDNKKELREYLKQDIK